MCPVYARRGFTKADEYYRQVGWDLDTGVPFPDTLRRLNMDEFIGEVAQLR